MRVDQRPVRLLRALLDFFSVILAFWTSYLLHTLVVSSGLLDRPLLDVDPYINIAMAFGALCIAVFWKMGLYRETASVLNLQELQAAVKGVLLSAALLLALFFLTDRSDFSRFVVFTGFGTSMLYIILVRRIVMGLIRRIQHQGRMSRRNILIYGSGTTGRLLMKKLLQAPHKACRIVGFLDDFAPRGATVSCRIDQTTLDTFETHVLGRLRDLPELVRKHNVDELLVTLSLTNAERHQQLLDLAREAGIAVGVVPRFGEVRADQIDVEDLSAIPVLRPSSGRRRQSYQIAKSLFDLVGASVLLLATAPIWLLSALFIRLESKGPVFFRQTRVGQGGNTFQIYKFRTMYGEVDPYMNSPVGDRDARITRVGSLLRMGGLDELPQLLNVLRGEMSLVGPRPEMPFIAERYSAIERQRLEVKPGITGIWQLSCDRHAEIHENLEYDLYYIRHQSLLLDILILLETLFFTIGLIPKARRRQPRVISERGEERPSAQEAGAPTRPSDDGYVLVALDQRRGEDLPESWLACAPAFYVLGSHSHVKVLVAPDNIAAFDKLVDRPEGGGNGHWTEYVPYTGRSELRALTLGARLVITDLGHVVQWAEEDTVDVLEVDGRRLRWRVRSPAVEPIIAELAECLDIEVEAAPDRDVQQAGAVG